MHALGLGVYAQTQLACGYFQAMWIRSWDALMPSHQEKGKERERATSKQDRCLPYVLKHPQPWGQSV